jgi:glycosyltransferase involved in cell wall biosynthesis
MGTFRRFHGLGTVLDAFAAVSTTVPNARLLLVGDGGGRAEVDRRIGELGLVESVILTGAVANRDLPRYVAAMDMALVSAPAESSFHYSPQKLREYLACGTPTVAPRVGDVERMVTDDVDALLYEPGDAAGLAQRIERFAADPELRSRLGGAGRALVEQRDTWDARLRDLLGSDAYLAAKARLTQG